MKYISKAFFSAFRLDAKVGVKTSQRHVHAASKSFFTFILAHVVLLQKLGKSYLCLFLKRSQNPLYFG